ncbi:hemerythrin domain-containing protein [Cognatishimia sp. F0-27]|nr:hemerythrin domain-containing protein [Cognatishimia sp. F0-27]
MRILLRDYPREAWPDHPDFATSIANWMGAHLMFRQLARTLTRDGERYLDRERDADTHAERLSRFGGALVSSLHGHHHWEDTRFFPELSAADSRFDPGIEILESDHEALDATLHRFERAANRVIRLTTLDEAQAREETADVLRESRTIEALLTRHLADEEDLVVPILLHHKLRG